MNDSQPQASVPPKCCARCGGPRNGKRSLCSTCRNQVEREKQQERRASRRTQQTCTHCGGPRDDEHLRCSACRKKIEATRRRHYHQDVKASRRRENEKHRKQRERRKLSPPPPKPELTPQEKRKIRATRLQALIDQIYAEENE